MVALLLGVWYWLVEVLMYACLAHLTQERPDDVQALIAGQKYIKAVIPAIVNIVYKKLLKYDITARVFTTRDSRDEGPIDTWATEESAQIQHRKMVCLYQYLLSYHLLTNCSSCDGTLPNSTQIALAWNTGNTSTKSGK